VLDHIAFNQRLEIRKEITRPLRTQRLGNLGKSREVQEHDRGVLVNRPLQEVGVAEDMLEQVRRLEFGECGFVAFQTPRGMAVERQARHAIARGNRKNRGQWNGDAEPVSRQKSREGRCGPQRKHDTDERQAEPGAANGHQQDGDAGKHNRHHCIHRPDRVRSD
jgi:hypothetical protein